jgi:superfamily II DNA or RNA helicase
MRNLLDKGMKVVWIAHRHELLNQAQRSFELVSYEDISSRKPIYSWRIISGHHDRPINIKPTDDLILASKSSLVRGFQHFVRNWLDINANKAFLVIDEAHHAAAKEYRELIEGFRHATGRLRMLGLTATPFRTAESEQGLLKKLFPDDIVYKIDLRELISRGILSEPIFESVPTSISMTELFREHNATASLERISKESFFDIDSIGGGIAKAIAENAQRNNAIVRHYLSNRDRYGKTLVFALNVDMAIALNALFRNEGVRSDFVVSSIKDMATGVTLSSKENAEKIQRFRSGVLEVLVNVNILTEGTDLPDVETVFLTRPTKSTILMTQMIGRALRGEKAGGTKNAFIVSFIDDWQEQIAWVNPERLFIDENVEFKDNDHYSETQAMRLIAIAKIEEFARIADGSVDPRLSDLKFIDRIPVGIYSFAYLIGDENEDERSINCEVLVYDNMLPAYEKLLAWLPSADIDNIETTADHINRSLFGVLDELLGYHREDIVHILRYYKQTQHLPSLIRLSERHDYDITELARRIVNNDLRPSEEKSFIEAEWSQNDSRWKVFFGVNNFQAFISLINSEKSKVMYIQENERRPLLRPVTAAELVTIQSLTLFEIRTRFPELGEKMRNLVYENYTDADGYYFCAITGYRSKRVLDFQIDHIHPMEHGGQTVLENLQLLSTRSNIRKASS